MTIKFKRLNRYAALPKYAKLGDAGMDVTCTDDAVVPPHAYTKLGTGLAADIPDGYEIQVRPRSGLAARYGIVCAFGTVDCGYKGEIGVTLYNHNDEPYYVKAGDRVAQLVVAPVVYVEVAETNDVGTSARGTDGFGSTGA